MNSTAFYILGIPIKWYGILIASGMVLGILIAKNSCKIKDIDYEKFLDILLIAIPSGIIGARIYYVIFEFNYYKHHLAEIINIRQGGLAIHGGVIFGIISALIYAKIKKLNFLRYADVAAPSIIIAQAIGRWGNFFNQEAYGSMVSQEFISHFPDFIQKGMYIGGSYYHPTFLYESMWDFSVFILLILLLRKNLKDGTIIFLYIGLYSLGRFFIEGLRTDSLMLGHFRVAQLVSLTGIILCLLFVLNKYIKKVK